MYRDGPKKRGDLLAENRELVWKDSSQEEIRMMYAVAQMCYQKEMTQEEVGKLLGISRPKVSRLLSQAREKGIVEVVVHNPFSRNAEVQSALIESFGLENAIITPYVFDKQEVIVPKIAAEAARYVTDNLPDGAVLGLGRGYSVYETAMALGAKYLRPIVLPLSGGIGEYDEDRSFNEIINRTAMALQGTPKFLYAPALLDHEKYRSAVLAEPRSQEIVGLWDRLDWVVLGIGTIFKRGPNPYYDHVLDGFLKEINIPPVTEVNLRFILPDGRIPNTLYSGRLVAASAEQIKRAKVRLAVAGGMYKLEAIYATLLSGLINVLVTDENTAIELVKLTESKKS